MRPTRISESRISGTASRRTRRCWPDSGPSGGRGRRPDAVGHAGAHSPPGLSCAAFRPVQLVSSVVSSAAPCEWVQASSESSSPATDEKKPPRRSRTSFHFAAPRSFAPPKYAHGATTSLKYALSSRALPSVAQERLAPRKLAFEKVASLRFASTSTARTNLVLLPRARVRLAERS